MTTRLLAAVLLTVTAMACGGCEAISHITSSILPDRQQEPDPTPMIYPAEAETDDALDIQIVRQDRRHIRFDNRTTQSLNDVTIWLNHEYGAVIDRVPIGNSGQVPLLQFVNQHGERYPVGSFLEPEKAKVLVLADAVVDGKLRKMNVRLVDEWDKP